MISREKIMQTANDYRTPFYSRLLFFDDQNLNIMKNVKRESVAPEKLSDGYVDPAVDLVNLCWGYPFVFYCEAIEKYVLYYQGWSRNNVVMPHHISLAAESDDGVNFRPLNMAQFGNCDDYILPNQVLPIKVGGFSFLEGQFFVDDNAKDLSEKYVALTLYKSSGLDYKAVVFTSADGLRWKLDENKTWHEGMNAPDYPISLFYNRTDGTYGIFKRPRHADRRSSVAFGKELGKFGKPSIVFQADAADKQLTDIYGVSMFPYADMYVGFIMLYHTPNYFELNGEKVSGLPTHKFLGGNVEPQLVYSYNGVHFNRFLREPFFGRSGFENGCMYPTCMVADKADDNIMIYVSATREEHGRINKGEGRIVPFRMRKDGFCCLKSENGIAELLTRGIYVDGEKLAFNVQCEKGGFFEIQVEDCEGNVLEGYAFADCVTFSGDEISHSFAFASGKTFGALKGKMITIRMRFENARIFGIEGDFLVVTPFQYLRHKEYGEIPEQLK